MVSQQTQPSRKLLAGAMKEKLFNLFLFVMGGLAWWFRKYSNDQSLGMLEQEAWLARRGITRSSLVARWLSRAV